MEKKRRGQMKLSFGMIFSILLIIFFIAFAFFAVNGIVGFNETAKLEKFVDDFGKDVRKTWRSAGSSLDSHSYSLPANVEKVCLVNPSDNDGENLEIHVSDGAFPDKRKIDYLDLSDVSGGDGKCFEPVGRRLKLTLEKDFGQNSVKVEEEA